MKVTAPDGVCLHAEDLGAGIPIVFIHEFAGDHRSWHMQTRFFARDHRCVTFAARGYLPSDIPADARLYGQDTARTDVIAVMDALGLERAHIVGHSMGAYTALHVGLHHPERCLSIAAIGCGWGSSPAARDASIQECEAIAAMFADEPAATAAARYARAPMRLTFEAKDPVGFGEFERMLAEHSGIGAAFIMRNVQLKRPTLWELEGRLKELDVALLVMVGDEDFPCIDGSVFLKRTVPTAALSVVPRSGHTLPVEEPAIVNVQLAGLFSAAESGTWMAHRRGPA